MQLLFLLLGIVAGASAAGIDLNTSTTTTFSKTTIAAPFAVAVAVIGGPVADHSTTTPAPSIDICAVCRCDADIECTGQNITSGDLETMLSQPGSRQLRTIDLSHNHLDSLIPFPPLTNLTKLTLAHNRINRIARFALLHAGLERLEQLDLSGNRLTFESILPDEPEQPNAEGSNVSDSNVTSIAFTTTTTTTTNTNEAIIAAISFVSAANTTNVTLPALFLIDLSENLLESLPLAYAFGALPSLRVLLLRANRFAYLYGPTVDAVAALPALALLDLSDNQLATLPPRFVQRLPASLAVLNLAGNRFVHVPPELGFGVALRSLDLGRNPLGDFVGNNTFPSMPALAQLTLVSLPHLQQVGEGAFSRLPNLQKLHLSDNNQLSRIDGRALIQFNDTTYDWPHLTDLDLSHNNLSYLPAGLLSTQRWEKLHSLNLAQNPWLCRCESQWLLVELMPLMRGKMTYNGRCGPNSDPRLQGFLLDVAGRYVESGYCEPYSADVLLLVIIFLSLFCLTTGCCLRLIRRIKTTVDPDGRGSYKQV